MQIYFGKLIGFTVKHIGASPKGVLVINVGAVISDNIFDGSEEPIGDFGEAITVFAAGPIIERNLFIGHRCDNQSSSSVVVTFNQNSAKIRNNVWASNDCVALRYTTSGGSATEVINNTFFDNKVGISAPSTAGAKFANNILVGGQVGVAYINTSQGFFWQHNLLFGMTTPYDGPADLTGIDGNIAADPLLQNPEGLDFHLAVGSPAIDAGLQSVRQPTTSNDRPDRSMATATVRR